jgi:hypothetical protein
VHYERDLLQNKKIEIEIDKKIERGRDTHADDKRPQASSSE